MSQGHNSNASTPAGSGSRSRQPSRTRATAGPSSNPTLQNRYRKPQKALDFSAHTDVTASEGTWSVEEEMQNYLRSPIPPRKSTDMVGYWGVWFNIMLHLCISDCFLEPRQDTVANNFSSICRLLSHSGYVGPIGTRVFLVCRNRYQTSESH
jgi:hypothetical protein